MHIHYSSSSPNVLRISRVQWLSAQSERSDRNGLDIPTHRLVSNIDTCQEALPSRASDQNEAIESLSLGNVSLDYLAES